MRKVLLVPGHGGKFTGRVVKTTDARGQETEFIESDINLKISAMINSILINSGVESILARDGDYELNDDLDRDLTARAELADVLGVDCLVSIHCNGFKDKQVGGFEIFTSHGQTKADNLAQHIFDEVEKTKFINMRKDTEDGDDDREAELAVLMRCECPAVLVEMGFITNSDDRRLLTGPEMPDMAAAVARGILRFVMP